MRDVSPWSVGIGHWFGVPVRLHVSFLLLLLGAMYVCTRPPFYSAHPDVEGLWIYGLLLIGIWLLAVALHAAGHAAAIARLDGSVDLFVLTPVGELADEGYRLDTHGELYRREPRTELIVALAGPITNLAAWLCCLCLLVALGEDGVMGLLNPFYPREMAEGSWLVVALKMGMWINWVQVLVGILPAYPLDGGRVLQCVLAPALGQRRAVASTVRATMTTAVVLLVLALLLGAAPERVLVPAWIPLVALAMYLYFHARQQSERPGDDELDDDLFGYDFSQGYTSLERKHEQPRPPRMGPLRRWIERRRREREIRREQIERDEEQRVDAILQRLHDGGPQSLSAEDRALLNRVSARYRSRPRSQSS